MVNFWTLFLFYPRDGRCFCCKGFPIDWSLASILSYIDLHCCRSCVRYELYKGKQLIYREASLQ